MHRQNVLQHNSIDWLYNYFFFFTHNVQPVNLSLTYFSLVFLRQQHYAKTWLFRTQVKSLSWPLSRPLQRLEKPLWWAGILSASSCFTSWHHGGIQDCFPSRQPSQLFLCLFPLLSFHMLPFLLSCPGSHLICYFPPFFFTPSLRIFLSLFPSLSYSHKNLASFLHYFIASHTSLFHPALLTLSLPFTIPLFIFTSYFFTLITCP